MLYLRNKISVIIPVFNAAKYVTKAVESALMQAEVAEVILVEDCSTDHSFLVCKQLADICATVKLFTHPNHLNRGAGASRNLGIKNATGDFIAFLDADDYFLPDRFKAEREIFMSNPDVDGVYGAMGFHYYSLEGMRKYREQGYTELTTIDGKISGKELCFSLLHLHPKFNGHFHLNTLTLKKEVLFGKTQWFNSLTMHEDTSFLVQLSINCNLKAGIIDKAIAMYGVHDANRIINNNAIESGSHVKYWKFLYYWSLVDKNGRPFRKLFHAFLLSESLRRSNKFTGFFKLIWFILINKLFLSKAIFFRPACLHVLNKNIVWYCINFKEQIQQKFFSKTHLSVYEEMADKF